MQAYEDMPQNPSSLGELDAVRRTQGMANATLLYTACRKFHKLRMQNTSIRPLTHAAHERLYQRAAKGLRRLA